MEIRNRKQLNHRRTRPETGFIYTLIKYNMAIFSYRYIVRVLYSIYQLYICTVFIYENECKIIK